MSAYYAENGEFYEPEYGPSRTKQSFKDETDINKLLVKAQKTGSLAHLVKHGAEYGDFTDMPDLLEAHARLARGQEIFDELPAEVKRDFAQSPQEFFAFVNDPLNAGELRKLLPAIAEPGNQAPQVNRVAGVVAPEDPPVDPPLEPGGE